jgi:hypothetical protein
MSMILIRHYPPVWQAAQTKPLSKSRENVCALDLASTGFGKNYTTSDSIGMWIVASKWQYSILYTLYSYFARNIQVSVQDIYDPNLCYFTDSPDWELSFFSEPVQEIDGIISYLITICQPIYTYLLEKWLDSRLSYRDSISSRGRYFSFANTHKPCLSTSEPFLQMYMGVISFKLSFRIGKLITQFHLMSMFCGGYSPRPLYASRSQCLSAEIHIPFTRHS